MPSTEFVLATSAFSRKWELTVTSRVDTGEQVNPDDCKVYQIFADNSANTADMYLKLYDTNSGSGVTTGGGATGSTDPDFVFLIPGGRTIDYTVVEGFLDFAVGLRALVSASPGTSDATGTTGYNSITVELYGTD